MIEKVEAKKYTCDNPACRREFTIMTGKLTPGFTGVIRLEKEGVGKTVVSMDAWWFAHSLRCVGPAVAATYKANHGIGGF